MLKVEGTTIRLTQGDSARIGITITTKSGEAYVPATGDVIHFYLKQNIKAAQTTIDKEVSTAVMQLELTADETKKLVPGQYVYDLELTKASGDVDTFINAAKLYIDAEVG
ncbi:hypothetical protein [Faecalibaculum rodentium]|uniref:hypothetical protein n=1 Tax=Faecalibaculum rodentium TaxID=1702221 RepID=UPI0027306F16|nr:hypothetical protein [Faecalibaculum rodentium]